MKQKQQQTILVVEDENDIRIVLCAYLQYSNFAAVGAVSGQDAIQLIPTLKPDLIILDLLMQPINGWEVLAWLKTHQPAPPIPVLILTALAEIKDQIKGLEEGAIEYMAKPAQPSKLVGRVRELLTLTPDQFTALRNERLKQLHGIMKQLYATEPEEFGLDIY